MKIYIRPYELTDLEDLLDLRVRNRFFLEPFEPIHSPSFYKPQGQMDWIAQAMREREADRGYSFGVFENLSEELVGHVALANVVRGAWQNCTIGYWVDRAHNGLGIGTEAVHQAVEFAFVEARLHRVQAAVMPQNGPSLHILQKVGFRLEGRALRYLHINGTWEDHDIYAMTLEDWRDVKP
jgi:ribosomal-protein-alanine N-acetyltransferase